MRLSSSAFEPGQTIPKRYTGEGENKSPALEWTDVPRETKELALLCEDPDASRAEPHVHWILFKIPAAVTKLAEGIPATERTSLPIGAMQGTNSSGEIGYRGPMPPAGHGRHRYFFRLYALDREVDLEPGAKKAEFMRAIEAHVLAHAELMGMYERGEESRLPPPSDDHQSEQVRRSA